MITIYTDGSGVNNPKNKHYQLGGYGVYIKDRDKEYYLSKGYSHTTTNRMEIRAVLYALKAIKDKSQKVLIYSDSQYVINSIMLDWINKWYSQGWNCKNSDLWKRMIEELNRFRKAKGSVVLKHIKGHQTNLEDPHVFGNNVVDALASYKNFSKYKVDKGNINSF